MKFDKLPSPIDDATRGMSARTGTNAVDWLLSATGKRHSEQCAACVVPPHASLIGERWVCDTGYKRKDDQCVRFTVPAHASVLGNSWVCDAGYKSDSEQCVRFVVPANARVAENDWVCNAGYERDGMECIKFAVPDNARVVGNGWYCNAGFREEAGRCIKLAPVPAKLVDGNAGAAGKGHDAGFDTVGYCFKGPTQSPAKCLEQQQLALQDDTTAVPKQGNGGMLIFSFLLVAVLLVSYWLLNSGRFRPLLARMGTGLQGMMFGRNHGDPAYDAGRYQSNHAGTNAGHNAGNAAGKNAGNSSETGAGHSGKGAAGGRQGSNPDAPLDPRAEWFKILCVAEHSTRDEIKKAYKRMVGQYHPDKVEQLGQELRDLAQSKTKQINIAYDHAMTLRKS